MTDADVLVVGGGAAGAAAALTLARGGRAVTVLEREPARREKVCGEFLAADATQLLDRLGLSVGRLGAMPVDRARLAYGSRAAEVALPFRAWGLPRLVLDEALLREACGAGATLLRGCSALTARREDRGWVVRLSDGAVLRGRHLILATGKHELRGHHRQAPQRRYLGLKLHLRLAGPLDGLAILHCRGGYGGLQPTTGGLANLCVALRPDAAGAAARDSPALLAHVAAGSALAARLLEGATSVTPKPLAVAAIPYGFRHRDGPDAEPTFYRVGDQASVVPSLAGDGVAMALASGIAAAQAILGGTAGPDFHVAWRRASDQPMRWAGAAAFALATMPRASVAVAARVPAVMTMMAQRMRLRDVPL